mmetsp:Transcript_9036/g.18257  ORF Transcript_9036/g.18257 Transcript_9036/m.18257 type:complete len:380 (-) Transcript_9036:29-1168(-)
MNNNAWIFGIILSVMGSFIGAFSKLLIRKSWKLLPPKTESPLSAENKEANEILVKKSKLYHLIGMVGMGIINPACGVVAMAFASPALLAPFSGLTLVWVIIFSKQMTGDLPNCTQVLAATMIVIGEVVVTLAGDHGQEEPLSIDKFNDIYRDSDMIMYMLSFTLCFAVVMYIAKWKEEWKFAHKIAWGIGGGSISGLLMFIKDALDLISTSNRFHWQIPVFIFLAIFVGVAGLIFLSHCMKRFDATYSASMFVVSYIVSATVMSTIRYNMFDRINGPMQLAFYPIGMTILFIGVYFLMVDKQFKFEQWKSLKFLAPVFRSCKREDDDNPEMPLIKIKKRKEKMELADIAEKGAAGGGGGKIDGAITGTALNADVINHRV